MTVNRSVSAPRSPLVAFLTFWPSLTYTLKRNRAGYSVLVRGSTILRV